MIDERPPPVPDEDLIQILWEELRRVQIQVETLQVETLQVLIDLGEDER